MAVRLDKVLSELGVASRRELKQIIKAGRVSVNGQTVTEPERHIDPDTDEICLDGEILRLRRFRYFMMDKPAGVLSVTEDRKQQTVLDLLPPELKRLELFPVGRLDKDTEGLLILTNDGDFAHRVISPGSRVNKIYLAEVEGTLLPETVLRFREGIVLKDGTECLPAKLEILRERTCLVTVQEGKYHQVRRMLAAAGNPVVTLRRLQIGALRLPDNSEPGSWRELSEEEKAKVFL